MNTVVVDCPMLLIDRPRRFVPFMMTESLSVALFTDISHNRFTFQGDVASSVLSFSDLLHAFES